MCRRTFLDRASRCDQTRGNRAQPGDSDQKAVGKEVQTSAMKTGARAVAELSARSWDQPRDKRSTIRLPAPFDKKLGVPRHAPFVEVARVVELRSTSWKSST